MKKNWSAPVVMELTIQATATTWADASTYGRGHGGNGGHGGHGGNGNLCRCQGGTSPCNKHHFGDINDGEELS